MPRRCWGTRGGGSRRTAGPPRGGRGPTIPPRQGGSPGAGPQPHARPQPPWTLTPMSGSGRGGPTGGDPPLSPRPGFLAAGQDLCRFAEERERPVHVLPVIDLHVGRVELV